MSDRRSSAPSKRPVHPNDAASVVLLRGSREDPEVLLGRRRLDARFMPGLYVFPGGRVDRADYRHAASALMEDSVLQKMQRHSISSISSGPTSSSCARGSVPIVPRRSARREKRRRDRIRRPRSA